MSADLLLPVAVADPRPGSGLDPRAVIILVLGSGVVLSSSIGQPLLPVVWATAVLLALGARAWRRAALVAVAVPTLAWLSWLAAGSHAAPVAASALGLSVITRLVAVGGVAAHLVATSSPTAVVAGLRAWRLPRTFTVPLAVMLRFIPIVRTETTAVLEARRMRGGSWSDPLRHPVRTIEQVIVPVVAASLRAGEDLSAAALLRGLGGSTRPTALVRPRLGWRDGLVLASFVAALLGCSLIEPWTWAGQR